MRRSRSPASSCCTAFGRDSSNCDASAFKIELHLQSGTQCFEPEPALRSKDCLLVLVICTRAAYGSGLMIGWLMRRQIEPHIPLLDREHQTNGFFTRANFTFDAQANVFVCPGGKQLKSTGLVRE